MTTQIVRLARRQAFALAAVLALVLGMIMFAPTSFAQEADDDAALELFTVSNAEFRWGINKQSSGPSHGPGHNFLSAGDISGAIKAPETMIKEADWKASVGNVSIEKRLASGQLSTPTFADTKTDQSGTAFASSSTKYGGLEALFANGTGTVDPANGTAEIKWSGTVSVLYYTGYVYLTVSDPELTVSPNKAQVTATVGGHSASRDGDTEWKKLTPRKVVIADLPRDCVTLEGDSGFSVRPSYLGVKYADKDVPQSTTGNSWGSFPKQFVDFAVVAGSGAFWYSSGGSADATKIALPISIGWDNGGSNGLEEICESPTSSTSKGILGQVIDDTVEDILRAAGTDVSDTAAAWMDEAWKPLQPEAVLAERDDAAAAAAAGDVGAEVVSQVDSEFEEYHQEYYAAGAPITAGTVAQTVASIPASTSRSAAAPASVPATGSADQGTVQMAATSPLYGADVVYAQTSGSSEAGGSSGQWQWWVGGALLAIAAMLVFQTVRR